MKKKLWIYIVLLGAVVSCFVGCQKAPEQDVVIDKVQLPTAPADHAGSQGTVPSEMPTQKASVSHQADFFSTDGSVHFTMDIAKDIAVASSDTVSVSPHYLTAEDAKRVATSLFPNAEFYEGEAVLAENYNRDEIREKIERWSQFTSVETLSDLYGNNDVSDTQEMVKNFIAEYSSKYDAAPYESTHLPCAWEMRKSSVYALEPSELQNYDTSMDNDEVCTQFKHNEIPYRLSVTTRNRDDFKVNMITLGIDDGLSPRNIDEQIFAAKLCRTPAPTDDQVESIKQQAAAYLEAFQLGNWEIDKYYVETREVGAQREYYVHVSAVPRLSDTPVLRKPQLTSLRNPDGYAASQYLTDAQFVFSPNADLLSLIVYTPLEVKNILASAAAPLGFDELFEIAKTNLSLSDIENYGFAEYLFFIDEPVDCNVHVTNLEYGLSRVRIPNEVDSYAYIPSVALYGSSEYLGKESGKLYYESKEPEVLLVLSALDGSVINATNT